jgi:hypothetical protein
MADSNISDSLCLYRGGEQISDGGTLFCGDKVSSIPCLLKLLDLDSSCGLPGMTVVSNSILVVSGNISPVVLAENTSPIFSVLDWWFFLPFISPSFSVLVFRVSGDVPPWSPADEMLSMTWLDELPLDFPVLDSEQEVSIAEPVFP